MRSAGPAAPYFVPSAARSARLNSCGSVPTVTPDSDAPPGSDEILFSCDEGVARLTLNRPDRHNALSWSLVHDLQRRLRALRVDPEVRVVVITGAGEKAFCAGADLGGMAEGAGYLDLHESRGELAEVFRLLWALGKPTIAEVRGYCLAGGFGLALACDLVLADTTSQFGTPEIDRGLWPFMITVPLLRSMPPKQVLELMMTGRRVRADEASRMGFVTRVCEPHALRGAVDELADTLASKPPGIMRLGRDAFYAVVDQGADDALRLLHPMLTVTTGSADTAEGITAFLEKRPPIWTGR